ncbi:MAG: LysE family transporter, partial [Pelagibacterales bacterium]|nr:LysE family transporter [Pelagibacterales bacterium]
QSTIAKTLGFTYLNPHVYSDTVFFLGNFSKNFLTVDKYYFGFGASIASFLFFFSIGYLSKILSRHLQSDKIWKNINLFIISFMSVLAFYVLIEILNFN